VVSVGRSAYTLGRREKRVKKRIFLVLAFGLLLSQATLVVSFLPCGECATETAGDDCAPSCETCVCCAMARLIVPAEPGVRALAPVGAVLPAPILPRCPADPRDIFHVPKPSLS